MTEGALHTIGAVERDTGVGRDTLRVWERRYGFPEPVRNEKGERLYPESQLRKLQRVKRLLSQGMRPGKLLALKDEELDAIESELTENSATRQPTEFDAAVNAVLLAVRDADINQVSDLFEASHQRLGSEAFITQFCMPLVVIVGEKWASGDLKIFEEHFLSQQMIQFLSIKISEAEILSTKPIVLLATLPGEEHSLGLLMLATLLSSRGVSTINLGADVPLEQIRDAVEHFNVDYVGLTFSAAYQYSNIRNNLLELRDSIPEDVDIWVGGQGSKRLRKLPEGISKITSFNQLPF